MKNYKTNSFTFTHDGDPEDFRLHVEDIVSFPVGTDEDFSEYEMSWVSSPNVDRLKTEKQYNDFYSFLDEISVEKEDFSVYAWGDISGYNYFKGDTNYVMITVSFDKKFTPQEFIDKYGQEIDEIIIEMNQKVYDKFRISITRD